ncbi:DUF6454 family protein [Streptomyces sp. NBC_01217]|uniref:DUF6454 family protein n=1 Tax=Streptomyces sp. NBC_01217 TaxID=2903779 RepID=UPI002E11C048|nr:DUF6454 family protein [Streptomyces sp. NBC_01217]
MRVPAKQRILTAALSLALLIGGTAAAVAAGPGNDTEGARAVAARHQPSNDLVRNFNAVTRDTAWKVTSRLSLKFPTYHTEGIAITRDHIFLSSVEILEPTVKYPAPRDGYDRTPGKGVGHVFVMDKQGNLQRDIVLGEGDMYHPGGLEFDGTSVWVSVAQYRPNSSTIMYRIDAKSMAVHKQFEFKDHIGGIVRDPATGHLIGNSWGSRHFYEWDLRGRKISDWTNSQYFVDYQDCQHAAPGQMLCGGVTNLPQTNPAGGSSATYELGGLALIDVRSHLVTHEVPFQQWSSAGHVATRNPMKLTANGDHLTLTVAPDNGDEGNGTEIITYEATVAGVGR